MTDVPETGVNEVRNIPSSGKTVKVGDELWPLRERDVAIQFSDYLVEHRLINGVVYLSFAQTVADGLNQPEVQVCCRLRMSVASAHFLHDVIGEIVTAAHKPPEVKAN